MNFNWLSSFRAISPGLFPSRTTFSQEGPALLVTKELEKALQECRQRVADIARDCRNKNRKFRDTEFDIENDRGRCLDGLTQKIRHPEDPGPSDVQRVTQIFHDPKFFVDGADSNDIVQSDKLGDCWFLSALATMSTARGLVDKFCVARDVRVGVYGFVFFRDSSWVTVIIDDMLYTSVPRFDELSAPEKKLYHDDKETYNKSARKNGKGLYFARSGSHGETWVPLIEKAYAKLHGSYEALEMGHSSEAIEDLTGGVSSILPTKDILDTDEFWEKELLMANKDRLFGCSFRDLDVVRSKNNDPKVDGLIGGHSYSVLRAMECRGRRFVVLRNPWGNSEWTGPWSDGSKEWTAEWLEVLPQLDHVFGDDGQFIMEYKDFLESWENIDRTRLFDSSWVMSSQWLRVPSRPLPAALTYGDVSFTFSLPRSSCCVIVLSQLDYRYFRGLARRYDWAFDFVVFKKGEKEVVGTSSPARFHTRSVNLDLDLEAGDYVVHVRLDRERSDEQNYKDPWEDRAYSLTLTERAKGQSIARNFQANAQAKYLPIPLDYLAGRDLNEIEQAAEMSSNENEGRISPQDDQQISVATTTSKRVGTTVSQDSGFSAILESLKEVGPASQESYTLASIHSDDDSDTTSSLKANNRPINFEESQPEAARVDPPKSPVADSEYNILQAPVSEDDCVHLGLRVYTNKAAPAIIGSQLRRLSQKDYLDMAAANE